MASPNSVSKGTRGSAPSDARNDQEAQGTEAQRASASISSETFIVPELGSKGRAGAPARRCGRHHRPELAGDGEADEIGHVDVGAESFELHRGRGRR